MALDFNRRPLECRALVMNDEIGLCSGVDFPWEEWRNVPFGSRFFRADGSEWKKISTDDGPDGWRQIIKFNEDVGKESFVQPTHGFVQPSRPIPVYVDTSGSVRPAIATAALTLAQANILTVNNIDEFEIVAGSSVVKFPGHDLDIGDVYYLSDTTAGAVTKVKPSQIAQPVYVALTDESILLLNRGIQVESSGGPSTALPQIKLVNGSRTVNLISKDWTSITDLNTISFNDGNNYLLTPSGVQVPVAGRYEVVFNPHIYISNSKKVPEFALFVNGSLTNTRSIGHNLIGQLELSANDVVNIRAQASDKKGTIKFRETGTSSLIIKQVR